MLKKFWNYIFSKRKELKDLDKKDIFLAKFMVDVGRNTKSTEFQMISLDKIEKIHVIDRGNALTKLNERIEILNKYKDEIIRNQNLSHK